MFPAPVDYKSHELNLYSNNSVGHLKFEDGKGSNKGPGFGQNQEYIFAKYTDTATSQNQWPVCIPELFTIDNASGYVLNIGWTITNEQAKSADEVKARQDADETEAKARVAADQKLSDLIVAESKAHTDYEALLAGQIVAETKARTSAVSAEAKARADADDFLQAQVGGLWGGLQTIEADSKARDSALDVKLGIERTRAVDAESKLTTDLAAEAKARADADSKLSDRIDFIVSNTNPSAIDSLSEIVSQFSQNGQGYASRLTYLESIVASLVNKSQ